MITKKNTSQNKNTLHCSNCPLPKACGLLKIYKKNYNIVEGLMRAITRCWWCAV